jgi:predicted polyphosphate/ATP-dependent NAD kinase
VSHWNDLVVLVCGGRDYTDWFRLRDELDDLAILHGVRRIVHGNACGADNLAMNWAEWRNIPQGKYPADWKQHGNAAGPIRNQQMLDSEHVDLVVAFPGGDGTADMVRRARAAGIPVKVIE